MSGIMLLKSCINLRNYSTGKSSFFVSTPIYYVNAAPHIGHLYSSVIADAIQRWQAISNPSQKIVFSTGTDEHGTKIQQAAAKRNVPVQEYCTNISKSYIDLANTFNIGYTDFIRTTEQKHVNAVCALWNKLAKNGYIYSSMYKGWYCVSDETFLTESQLLEVVGSHSGEKFMISTETHQPAEWTEEQNYIFRLSGLKQKLVDWLTKNEDVIKPKKFQKILLDMITNEELPDVSISRPSSRVFWGINVPGDDSQTIYVWLDALVNYLTVAGYPKTDGKFEKVWPPDVQVIGKDILKFHGIYWPAFLMAAGLDLPRSLFCHSHWTVDDRKMSKSRENVICPVERSNTYTTDGIRYFLLREGVAHSDGNFSETKIKRILNSELADTFGNLLSRCCSKTLNPKQIFPEAENAALNKILGMDVTMKLLDSLSSLPDTCEQHYSEFNFYKVVDATIASLHSANLFFETLKPWELQKNAYTQGELHVSLHIAMETLRICSIILQPIIPNITKAILDKLQVPSNERSWSYTKIRSWSDSTFKSRNLLQENVIVYKRIVTEEKKKVKQ